MHFLWRIAAKTLVNAAALAVAVRYISGFSLAFGTSSFLAAAGVGPFAQSLLLAGITLAVLNTVLRPVLKIVSFPFIILTFGLFHVVINMAILKIADIILPSLTIAGLKPLFLSSLLIGIANSIL